MHDRIDLGIGEHLVEARRRSSLRMSGRGLGQQIRREVAEPAQIGEVREVPCHVRAPVPETRMPDPDHSFQTFPSDVPFDPVAFLRSTTSGACSTSSS